MATTVSSLARTRAPANSSKPLQPSAPRPPASVGAVSNVSLFLTNLRLLDLDLHPEWPDINASTFSSRDAAQGQKRRIQCVEWALYQLFCLWDPEEARNKLRPFFPPLDQVQSLNLRAALQRSLEQAKKNGVLGRDAVVRKTMLDECKGERLEEVLAVFSSAVLKKLVSEHDDSRVPLAQVLALENRGYSGDRAQLAALVITHKASLGRGLQQKGAARARYDDFADLLRLKERSLLRRKEQTKEQPEAVPQDVRLDVRRAVRNNWSGHERWMDTLLYGDGEGRRDGLLSTPFDRVWRRVEAGRLAELEDDSRGLLEQLDARVRTQRERLEKWQRFRREVQKETRREPAKEERQAPRRGIDLGFGAHESLHLGKMSPRKLARKPELTGEYRDLVRKLEEEIGSIEKGRRSLALRPPQTREATPDEVISELDDYDDEPVVAESKAEPPAQRPPEMMPISAEAAAPRPALSRQPIPRAPVMIVRPNTPPSPSPQLSPTQLMADEIIASVNDASPSPQKLRHTLSLAERTRLSMVRRGSQAPLDDEPDLLPLRRTGTTGADTTAAGDDDDDEDDILARTRRSMAGLGEAAQRRASVKRPAQRKPKPSITTTNSFPAVDEEDGNSTLLLAEELINGGQGYEAVFMSRPKIKTSPIGTPVRESHE